VPPTDTADRRRAPTTRRAVVATGARLAYAAPLLLASFNANAPRAAAASDVPGEAGGGSSVVEGALAAGILEPIDAGGSSVFSAKRGVVPVKFALLAGGAPTCALPPAAIAVWRLGGPGPEKVNQDVYESAPDGGGAFRVAGCEYHYNLAAQGLGPGRYQVDVVIDGVPAGSASFGLR
jgi:hypothetical protein